MSGEEITGTDAGHAARRRDLLAAPLLPLALLAMGGPPAGSAAAGPLDPEQTIIRPPDRLRRVPSKDDPERSVDRCALTGNPGGTGLYDTPIRWRPGSVSAPHTHTSDRFCIVLSGTWWCNGGPDFDPAARVPVKAGSDVRRVAGTPHDDGVVRDGPEPAVSAICGIAPVG